MVTAVDHGRTRRTAKRDARGARGAIGPDLGHNVPSRGGRAVKAALWGATLTRVALVPIFVLGALRAQALARAGLDLGLLRWTLVAVLGLVAASDVLDGWIARRHGLASQAGAVVDALADKLAQLAFVAVFAFDRGPAFAPLPIWFFVLLLARDLVLGGGWVALRVRDVTFEVVHRLHGRASTVVVFATLFWVAAGFGNPGLRALVLLAAALIWVSTAAYVIDAKRSARNSARVNAGVLP